MPTQSEVIEFMEVAKQLNLSAVNFWYWEGVRKYMPEYWDLVSDFQYSDPTPVETSLPDKYVNYLNNRQISEILNLYSDRSVLITSSAAALGKSSIQQWLTKFIKVLGDAEISIVSQSQHTWGYHLKWQASNGTGLRFEGQDTLGILDQKIIYHYSFVRQLETTS